MHIFKDIQGSRSQPPKRSSTPVHFTPLKSMPTMGQNQTEIPHTSLQSRLVKWAEDLYYWNTERLYVWQRRLEGVSCVSSLICLVVTSVYWGANQGSIKIELTRNVAFSSQNSSFTEKMRLWHTAVAESCAAGNFDLILTQPPWENKEKKYDGFSIEGVIHNESYIDLTAVAFFIYLFSSSFQGLRCWRFNNNFKPLGPEFSRWSEYACTSPLQILLVALTFGISNIDILLGYFGMQLAMVIMGYSIEKQIKKKYLRDPKKTPNKFYWVSFLPHPLGPDVRGVVYLLVSWTLHILIWGIPGLWETTMTRWGISGQYAYITKYQTICGDPDFNMPVFVEVIFWGQFICFLLFGLVCTLQFLRAEFLGAEFTPEIGDAKRNTKMLDTYAKEWAKYSMAYAILSVTAKTLLEVGFIGLLVSSPNYLQSKPLPKTAVQMYANVTGISRLGNDRPISVSPDTSCFQLLSAAK